MTTAQLEDQRLTDVRQQLDNAAIHGAVLRGELTWTYSERLDRLMTRLRGHQRHGRPQAAQACRRMVERMLDEMEGM